MKRDAFQKHVQEVCPISCPNDCGVLQTRAGLDKHLEACLIPCEAVVVRLLEKDLKLKNISQNVHLMPKRLY
jgi:hypothetical protein